MQAAVPLGAGRMVAIIGAGLERALVERALAGLAVVIANDNSPDQVVLSGAAGDVAAAAQRLGDLRCVDLEVSAPFHSPSMAPIEPAFAAALASASIQWDGAPAPSVTSNLTGGFHDADLTTLRARLVRQVSGAVLWRQNMAALTAVPTAVIEIGPGRPLRGFFKAIGVAVHSITDLRSADRLASRRVAA
jgi:[acyl-carrier-protein] S-malonyltransferase/trans-AT polyketide synthase/acyltransferase/oxidoreductase domain-containing protein